MVSKPVKDLYHIHGVAFCCDCRDYKTVEEFGAIGARCKDCKKEYMRNYRIKLRAAVLTVEQLTGETIINTPAKKSKRISEEQRAKNQLNRQRYRASPEVKKRKNKKDREYLIKQRAALTVVQQLLKGVKND